VISASANAPWPRAIQSRIRALFPRSLALAVTGYTLYGGSLTLISASDSFKRIQPTLRVRIILPLTTWAELTATVTATDTTNGRQRRPTTAPDARTLYGDLGICPA